MWNKQIHKHLEWKKKDHNHTNNSNKNTRVIKHACHMITGKVHRLCGRASCLRISANSRTPQVHETNVPWLSVSVACSSTRESKSVHRKWRQRIDDPEAWRLNVKADKWRVTWRLIFIHVYTDFLCRLWRKWQFVAEECWRGAEQVSCQNRS